MLFGLSTQYDFSLPALRRKDLLQLIKSKYPQIKDGLIVFIAGFENERIAFRQESSFFYFTGIQDPGVILTMDFQGKTTLYVPQCKGNRAAWIHSPILLTQENAKTLHIDTIANAGEPIAGYQLNIFHPMQSINAAIEQIKSMVAQGGSIFTPVTNDDHSYIEQRIVLKRLATSIENLEKNIIDVADIIAMMRRRKDMHEIEQLYKSIEITTLAQEAAAKSIADGITECEVQASLEYMFTGSCARPAFPSIVATGKNATVLHYMVNKDTLKNGQLVVVDIGAEFDYYCADLTRTYPVSGKFTKRQRELYEIVLATQEYIAEIAKPGFWISNKEKPEKSLHHLAVKFLEERGYAKYFIHGIGHFLGMDVHDVGNTLEPLQEGDVFTIEPGIYIPEENIGIRIEDDYWMVKDGVICLSESLPKTADAIEQMMAQELDDEEMDEEEDSDLDQDLDFAQG
jgi:Xaa-Pro aminopeptidase